MQLQIQVCNIRTKVQWDTPGEKFSQITETGSLMM